jgi:hypothetical protein
VYNTPYRENPKAFSVDIETQLRSSFHAGYEWKVPNKEKIEFFRE